MIEKQLIDRGISDDKVLEVMSRVQRHYFVPGNLQAKAYDDTALPIGFGQTISQPYMVAFMTEILNLSDQSKVLEIGTGSGYQTAILAEICKEVYTLEVLAYLSNKAKDLLNQLNYDNIYFKVGDGYLGWAEFAPYDAVIVTCAPSHIPEALKTQLGNQGQMILPVGDNQEQKLLLLKKKGHKIVEKSIFQVKFVPMTNANGLFY